MSLKSVLFGASGADTTPAPFAFTDQTGVEPSSTIVSNLVTITDISGTTTASVSAGGLISINGGAYVTSGTVQNGDTIRAQLVSSSSFNTQTSITVTVGGISDTWFVTTRPADQTPVAFSFTSTTGANPSSTQTSNTVTVTGLEPNFTITVSASGGTVDAGTTSLSGTFASSKTATTTASGTLVVAARGTASSSFGGTATVTITIGTGSATYTITTRAADTTPDAFSFGSATGVNPSSSNQSGTITVSGLEPNTAFTITASGGFVDAGTSGLSGTFDVAKTVTTSGSGTLRVAALGTASSSFSTGTSVSVSIGTGIGTFYIETRAADTSGSMVFSDVSDAQLNTTVTSSTITATGFEPNFTFTISASGGLIDAGTTGLSGTFASSRTITTSGSGSFVIAARVTSSSAVSTAVNCVVTAGSTSDTFTVITRAADTTPDAYSFTSATNVALSSTQTSSTITVAGLEPSTPITITASNGLVDAGTTSLSGSFAASKTVTATASGTIVVAARGTASSSPSTSIVVTVNVGSGSGTFTITTQAADTTPDTVTFTNRVNKALNSIVTHSDDSVGVLTVTGLQPSFSITISVSDLTSGANGQIDAGTTSLSGVWATSKTVTTTASGTLVLNVRLTTSGSHFTERSVAVVVGASQSNWTVRTVQADALPSNWTVDSITNADPNTLYQSPTYTLTGLEPSYAEMVIETTSGSALIDAGTTSLSGTFSSSKTGITTSPSGTMVWAYRITSGGFDSTTSSTIRLKGGSNSNNSDGVSTTTAFSITTRSPDSTPDPFSFTSVSGAAPNTTYDADVTVTGLSPSAAITVSSSGGTIDVGTSGPTGSFSSSSRQVTSSASGTLFVRARITSSGNFSTAASMTVNIGTGSATFTVTTRAIDLIGSFQSQVGQAVPINTLFESGYAQSIGFEPYTNFIITPNDFVLNRTTGTGEVAWSLDGSSFSAYAASPTVYADSTGGMYLKMRQLTPSTNWAPFNNTWVATRGSTTGSSLTYNGCTVASYTYSGGYDFTQPAGTYVTRNVTIQNLPAGVTLRADRKDSDPVELSWDGTTWALAAQVTTSTSGDRTLYMRVASPGRGQVGGTTFHEATVTNVTERDLLGAFFSQTVNVGLSVESSAPFPFTFGSTSAVPYNAATSSLITVTGLTSGVSYTVFGTSTGTNSAVWGAQGGTINRPCDGTSYGVTAISNGIIQLQVTGSVVYDVGVITLTVAGSGGESTSGTFTINPIIDTEPNPFSFTNINDAALGSTQTSSTVTVTGLAGSYPITVSATGGLIDAGTTALSGTFASSKTVTTTAGGTLVVAARGTASSDYRLPAGLEPEVGRTQVTVNVGSGAYSQNVFTIYTVIGDYSFDGTSPDGLYFPPLTGATPNTFVTTSSPLTLTGLSPNMKIVVSAATPEFTEFDIGATLSGSYSNATRVVTTSASGTLQVMMRFRSPASGFTSTGEIDFNTPGTTSWPNVVRWNVTSA